MQLHASREYKRTPFKFIILLCNIMNMYNIYCGPGKFTIWPKLYPGPWPVPRRSLAEDE